MFKGYIDGGNKKVVIKRLKSNIGVKHYMEHECRHFYQEIVMLSKTNHYNVMSWLGIVVSKMNHVWCMITCPMAPSMITFIATVAMIVFHGSVGSKSALELPED